ncbi:hypothetical protein A8B78_11970 [Jannaschia sp. EhC01]|nr:hypothetical protein A8B78_11970 [Jannaschia sp. EhC01]
MLLSQGTHRPIANARELKLMTRRTRTTHSMLALRSKRRHIALPIPRLRPHNPCPMRIKCGTLYIMDKADGEACDAEPMHPEVGADRNKTGTFEDNVQSHSGQMIGLLAEVGGFLDIGDSLVMIAVDDLKLVAVDAATCSFVTGYNDEQLEEMESADEGFWNQHRAQALNSVRKAAVAAPLSC